MFELNSFWLNNIILSRLQLITKQNIENKKCIFYCLILKNRLGIMFLMTAVGSDKAVPSVLFFKLKAQEVWNSQSTE